jgi:hypothetical protein
VIEPVVHAPVFRQSFGSHRVEGTAHRCRQVFVVKPLVTGPAGSGVNIVLRKDRRGRGQVPNENCTKELFENRQNGPRCS